MSGTPDQSIFTLDERLAADCHFVADLTLSRLLLMNNAQVPWLILVPRKVGCTELTDLNSQEQALLLTEINGAHRLLAAFTPDKINTGALGNVVSQLHIHVLGRYKTDSAWPAPVWGQLPAMPYSQAALTERIALIKRLMTEG